MADETLIMATPAEVAARDGVTKQAVTKIVRRLVSDHDLPVERDQRDRIARFSLAHYDHLRGAFDSSEKVRAARTESDAPPSGPSPDRSSNSRDEAMRQEAWLRVGRQKLQAQEEASALVRADRLAEALTGCGHEIRALLARLPNKADDLALAVSREGVHGLRTALRALASDLGNQVADRLVAVGAAAPEHDPLIEEET